MFLLQNNSLGWLHPTHFCCQTCLSLGRPSSSDLPFLTPVYICLYTAGNRCPGTLQGSYLLSTPFLRVIRKTSGSGLARGGVGAEGAQPFFLGYRQECEWVGSCPTPTCGPAEWIWTVLPWPQLLHTSQIKHRLTDSTAVSWRSLKNDFPAVRGFAIVLCLATFSTGRPTGSSSRRAG